MLDPTGEIGHGGNGLNSGNDLGKPFDCRFDKLLLVAINNDGRTLSS
jgi:hypothetical protein